MASKDVLNTTIVTHAKGKIMFVKHDNRTHLPQGTPSPCVCTVLSAGGFQSQEGHTGATFIHNIWARKYNRPAITGWGGRIYFKFAHRRQVTEARGWENT